MKIKAVILCNILLILTACSDTTSSSPKNYDHYTRNFETMASCLDFIANEAQNAGMKLDISRDKPDKVSGSFNGDSDMFFYCEKQETGTSGTIFVAAYPKFN